jgi:hypothetical protein
MMNKMKVLQWSYGKSSSKLWFECSYLVLWDGEFTYWCDEMKPSPRYKMTLKQMAAKGFTYVGDL